MTVTPAAVLSCPACQRESSGRLLQQFKGYDVLQCSNCGVHFSDPMRPADAAWYEQSSVYSGRRLLQIPLPLYEFDWRFQTFFRANLAPSGRLLDVGCGAGQFLRLARRRGFQVAGIDYDREAVQIARESYNLTDVCALSAEEARTHQWEHPFDVITLFDVVEHFGQPIQTLRNLSKLLTPGGFLVCSVPSAQRWPARFHPELDCPPHHLTLWTPVALRACLTASGLSVCSIRRSPLRGADLLHSTEGTALPLAERIPLLGTAVMGVSYAAAMLTAAVLSSVHHPSGSYTLEAIAQRPK